MPNVSYTDTEVTVTNTSATLIAAGAVVSACKLKNESTGSDVVTYTDDGSTPSANHGHALTAGQGYEYDPRSLPNGPIKVFSAGTGVRVSGSYA